jgi:hypothetical protein
MQQQLHASSTEGQLQYNITTELLKHTGDGRSQHISTQHLTYIYSGYITSIPNIKYKICFKGNLYNEEIDSKEDAHVVIFLDYFPLRKKVGSEITMLIVCPPFKLSKQLTDFHETWHKHYTNDHQSVITTWRAK